jgi:hypothetical protein
MAPASFRGVHPKSGQISIQKWQGPSALAPGFSFQVAQASSCVLEEMTVALILVGEYVARMSIRHHHPFLAIRCNRHGGTIPHRSRPGKWIFAAMIVSGGENGMQIRRLRMDRGFLFTNDEYGLVGLATSDFLRFAA